MRYSDEPTLLPPEPKSRWRRRAVIGAAVVLVGLIAAVPTVGWMLEEAAAHAPRGPLGGHLLRVAEVGTETTLELAWYRGRLAVRVEPANEQIQRIEVSGRFGREELHWNEELKCFGPTAAVLGTEGHHRVRVTLLGASGPLWTRRTFAYGIVDGHRH